jgi:hypothetical protein
MSGWFVETVDRPLCPMNVAVAALGYSPFIDRHAAWVEIQNEVYAEYERDEDGELIGGQEVEIAYADQIKRLGKERLGILVGQYEDGMRLHTVTVEPRFGNDARVRGHFAAAYLVCPVCLFVLPGQIVE